MIVMIDPEIGEYRTCRDVFETLTERDKNTAYYLVGRAIEDAEQGKPVRFEHPIWDRLNPNQIRVVHFFMSEAIKDVLPPRIR